MTPAIAIKLFKNNGFLRMREVAGPLRFFCYKKSTRVPHALDVMAVTDWKYRKPHAFCAASAMLVTMKGAA